MPLLHFAIDPRGDTSRLPWDGSPSYRVQIMSENERGIRTERRHSSRDGHTGFGAGSGDTERYEFDCPCGKGMAIEEHDNIPGFQEHDVRLICDSCKGEWDFVPGLSVRDWRLEPKTA